MSDSLRPHGLQPTRLLCPWDFPGKSTGVGVPLPSPGDLPDPGIEPRSPALQADALPSELNSPIPVHFGEGNGTPLQYSCLENPMDGGAW